MGKKILIADDDESVRWFIKNALKKENEAFEIFEVQDGLEAVEATREIHPDVLILDIMMPGMNGYEVCKSIKSSESTKDTFILVITGRGSELSKKTMEIVGADGYLAKPFSPDDLDMGVNLALGVIEKNKKNSLR